MCLTLSFVCHLCPCRPSLSSVSVVFQLLCLPQLNPANKSNPANKREPIAPSPIQVRKWHPGHAGSENEVNGLIESRVSSVDIIKKMAGYVWPKDRKEIKQRVVVSLGLLVLAKIVNVSVPFIFKHTIDLLNNKGTVQLALDTPAAGAGTAIFCLVLGCKFE